MPLDERIRAGWGHGGGRRTSRAGHAPVIEPATSPAGRASPARRTIAGPEDGGAAASSEERAAASGTGTGFRSGRPGRRRGLPLHSVGHHAGRDRGTPVL